MKPIRLAQHLGQSDRGQLMDVSLRFNILTNEWVIVSPARSQRPHDLIKPREEEDAPQPSYRADCPFCPGNEQLASQEIFRLHGRHGEWQTRVVYNKYPALSHDLPYPRMRRRGLQCSIDGFGIHEVIIDSPRHNDTISDMSRWEVETLFETYRQRYQSCLVDSRVAHIIIFKNYGRRAGTSLQHPHSQLIATPVVSFQVSSRLQMMEDHAVFGGRCLACRMLDEERRQGLRIITETEHFMALIPYAALSSFHTWVFPKRHMPHFGEVRNEELSDLASLMQRYLRKLSLALNNPDYNYVIRSAPREMGERDFHWYISIVPRLAQAAGFELGTGMYINTSLPEDSAAYLRSVKESEEHFDPTISGDWEIPRIK